VLGGIPKLPERPEEFAPRELDTLEKRCLTVARCPRNQLCRSRPILCDTAVEWRAGEVVSEEGLGVSGTESQADLVGAEPLNPAERSVSSAWATEEHVDQKVQRPASPVQQSDGLDTVFQPLALARDLAQRCGKILFSSGQLSKH
jgi:hypothetical protein